MECHTAALVSMTVGGEPKGSNEAMNKTLKAMQIAGGLNNGCSNRASYQLGVGAAMMVNDTKWTQVAGPHGQDPQLEAFP